MTEILRERFIKYIEDQNLLHPASFVTVGVSGGADSVCLLILLNDLRKKSGIFLNAVHVNHMLRGQASDEDEAFVTDLCERMNIPLKVFRRDIAQLASERGESLEEAGRIIRYEILADEALKTKDGSVGTIAVAHHKNDNAETFILNLARGASVKGLSGMKSKTRINGIIVIRPLLFASRNEIEEFLSEIGQEYRTDISNSDEEYSRNRVRNNVIPELKKINDSAVDHIIKSAADIRQAYEYVENAARKEASSIISAGTDIGGHKLVTLNISALMAEPRIIASKVVYEAIGFAAGKLKDISDVHVENVLSLAKLKTGSKTNLPYGLTAARKYESIVIKPSELDISAFSSEIHTKNTIIPKNAVEKSTEDILIGDLRITVHIELVDVTSENFGELTENNQYTKAFDYAKINRNFVFGTRKPGDFIRVSEGRKSLNRFFIDEKIPSEERDRIALLKDDDEVIWIIGYRISEKYKITAETKQAVKVSIGGGEDGY